eukprot:TRINITY_DN3020_c0_g1_i3.p1 TRINITY_DN3020_c0_g1~~TRINITY_DN3020_c0_g1_i3.p1  ORF type:complete len:714 (+),score=237.46 TRINITY_DN3020_c0_g1_i3:25-2142(+)
MDQSFQSDVALLQMRYEKIKRVFKKPQSPVSDELSTVVASVKDTASKVATSGVDSIRENVKQKIYNEYISSKIVKLEELILDCTNPPIASLRAPSPSGEISKRGTPRVMSALTIYDRLTHLHKRCDQLQRKLHKSKQNSGDETMNSARSSSSFLPHLVSESQSSDLSSSVPPITSSRRSSRSNTLSLNVKALKPPTSANSSKNSTPRRLSKKSIASIDEWTNYFQNNKVECEKVLKKTLGLEIGNVGEMMKINEQLKSITDEKKSLVNQLSSLESTSKLRQGCIEDLEKELASLQSKMNTAFEKREDWKGTVEALKKEVTETNSSKDMLGKELKKLKVIMEETKTTNEVKVSNLQEQIKQLQNEIDENNSKSNDSLPPSLDDFSHSNNSNNDNDKRHQEELKVLQEEIESLEKKIKKDQDEHRETMSQFRGMQSDHNSLSAQMNEREKKIKELENKLSRHATFDVGHKDLEISRLKRAASAAEADKQSAEARLMIFESDLRDAERRAQANASESNGDCKKAKCVSIKESHEDLESKMSVIELELKEYKQQYESLKLAMKDMDEDDFADTFEEVIKEEFNAMKRSYEAQIKQLNERIKEMRSSRNADLAAVKGKLENGLELKEYKQQYESLKLAMKDMDEDDFADTFEEVIKEEFNAMKRSYEAQIKQLNERIKEMRSSRNADLAAVKGKLENGLEKISMFKFGGR